MEIPIFLISLSSTIIMAFIIALGKIPSKDDLCKNNPRFKRGYKNHKEEVYKIVFTFNGSFPLYIVYYRCKYCKKYLRAVYTTKQGMKDLHLFKYTKVLGYGNMEINLDER